MHFRRDPLQSPSFSVDGFLMRKTTRVEGEGWRRNHLGVEICSTQGHLKALVGGDRCRTKEGVVDLPRTGPCEPGPTSETNATCQFGRDGLQYFNMLNTDIYFNS